ncbi:MAG TPA: SLBB domain-containing protein [Gemmatimonadales bacterium]|nr:SLBB domain-containing protein [Gemmatimonadales bacterium]
MRASSVLGLLGLVALGLPSPGAAQSVISQADSAARRLMARRDELNALAQVLDSVAASPSAGLGDRNRARPLAAQIRARLETGDFQPGDRVVVRAPTGVGDSFATPNAPAKSAADLGIQDTFAVQFGPALVLPSIGEVPLRGVLRSELEDQVTRYVSRLVRDPEVHARALMRLSVQGEVAKPGYYSVLPEAPLADLVTAAGGYTTNAKVADSRIQRGEAKILEKEKLRLLMAQGTTLDAAGIRPGDELLVPKKKNTDVLEGFRLAAVLLGIPLTVYALTHLHN